MTMVSSLLLVAESRQSSSSLTNKSVKSDTASESKSKNPSPRSILDELEAEYQGTEDDNSSCGDSSITDLTSATPNLTSKSNFRRQGFSPCTLIFSFLGSPFRKRNVNKQMKQPLLRCFSYDEIMNATNNFNPGENA